MCAKNYQFVTFKGEIMDKIELNDHINKVLLEFIELESMMQVLKEASFSKSHEISMEDVGNTLEVMVDKAYNAKTSLNKYINAVFCKEE